MLDADLPGRSGLDLQRQLADADKDMPVIFITGRGDIPMAVQAMKAGAVEFLTKPFVDEELLSAMRHAIGRSERPGTMTRSCWRSAAATSRSLRESDR